MSRRGRIAELQLAGLAPVELPDALAKRLRRLNSGGASMGWRNVWRRDQAAEELYLLDLWDKSAKADRLLVQGLVVFVSRKLVMPRIQARPRPGWLERLWGQRAAEAPGLSRVGFPEEPHLEAALTILSDDVGRARELLGGSRGLWLAQLPSRLSWDGEGDLLCVRPRSRRLGAARPTVLAALENALALYSILTR
jgi:hypothetical protein